MLERLKNHFVLYKWALVSGVFIGTTFIPFPPWALVICFVPLWYFWLFQAKSLKQVLISGFYTQFLLTLIGFNWVAHTLAEFGHMPFPLSFFGLFGFCAFANLHIPIAGGIWYWCKNKFQLNITAAIFLLPLLTGLLELNFPMIFDWHFGYTWYWADFPGIQTAEIWGTKFLSTFSIFLNSLALFALANKSETKKWMTSVATLIGLFLAVNIFGWALKNRLPKPDSEVRVLIVQANIGNLEKQYAEQGLGFRDHIANEYFQLTKQGYDEAPENEKPDFAIWPETAFPVRLNPSGPQSGLGYRLTQFLNHNQIALFSGSYGLTRDAGGVSNSLFVFDDKGVLQQPVYTKTTLLAFGEYIPGGSLIPQLYDWLPMVAHFSRGQGPTIQTLNGVQYGPQICYEGLFDWFSRKSAQLGAQVLVNVTNDSWYGTWQQPFQHAYMTLSRAIEVRRPLIRSTNTGISTVVLANGDVMPLSPLHEKWSHVYKVPYYSASPLTLFSQWGYWFPYIFLILLGALVFGIQRSHNS